MTQENAAERAQNNNEFDETTAAVESFAQDWLAVEGLEDGREPNHETRPRVVATLPDWSTFARSTGARRDGGIWREILRDGKTKTVGVALAAFGLGVLCASGDWRRSEKTTDDPAVAATNIDKKNENGLTFELETGGAPDGSLAPIDSSTLRSVPDVASVDFSAVAPSNSSAPASWANEGVLAENVGFSGQAEASASADGVANEATVPTSATANDSSWRRGVDFERGLETIAGTNATAEGFPTWEDLETGVDAPSVEEILNSPIGAVAGSPVASNVGAVAGSPVASNVGAVAGSPVVSNVGAVAGSPVVSNVGAVAGSPVASNVGAVAGSPVASNVGSVANDYWSGNGGASRNSASLAGSSFQTSAGYAAYNDGAGNQGNNGANLNAAAPQFAGNSQISGYNQTDGSENFAGWPTATPRFATSPAPNVASPTVAPVAEPPRAMVAQTPNENVPVATPNAPATNRNLRW